MLKNTRRMQLVFARVLGAVLFLLLVLSVGKCSLDGVSLADPFLLCWFYAGLYIINCPLSLICS